LELLKLVEGFQHVSIQPHFVEAEIGEFFRAGTEGSGGGERGMNIGMLGVEVACVFKMRVGEHAVFDGANAVDAPLIVGDGLGELALEGRLRAEAVDDFF
jgi:hypothetical protein